MVVVLQKLAVVIVRFVRLKTKKKHLKMERSRVCFKKKKSLKCNAVREFGEEKRYFQPDDDGHFCRHVAAYRYVWLLSTWYRILVL